MTFTSAEAPRARFRLGEALEATFSAVFAHFAVFLLLAVVIYALPNLLLALAIGPRSGVQLGVAAAILSIVRAVLNIALTAILQGALVRGVVTHMNGGRPTFEECLRSGVSVSAPLVAIGLLAGLGISLGFLLLIAPGLFLVSMWALVAPVRVAEGRGVFSAFSRSAALTLGHRWAVLGAIVIMGVIAFVLLGLGGGVTGILTGFGRGVGGVSASPWPLFALGQVVTLLASAVGSIFSSALPAVLYSQLRRSKEGAAPAQLAALFD